MFRTLNFWHAAQQAYTFGMMDPVQFQNVCADVKRIVTDSPGFRRISREMLERFPLAQQHDVFQPIVKGEAHS